jgi:four helix bundle protein
MLRIYAVTLDWIESVSPVVRRIASSDPRLADQLRRSSTSVGLNVSEGMGATGLMKRKAYRIALQEMRESVGAIEIAVRLGYVNGPDDQEVDRQGRIIGTLVKLARPED